MPPCPNCGLKALTVREKQVLIATAEGKTVKDIALSLDISIKSVSSHKYNLMIKLDLHSSFELVRYAVEHGYVMWNIPNQLQWTSY